MSNQTTNNITNKLYEYNNHYKTFLKIVLEELEIKQFLEYYLSIKQHTDPNMKSYLGKPHMNI